MPMVVLKPEDLQRDKQFQEKFPLVEGKLQQLLFYMQRKAAREYANEPEEAGRRVLILTEIMEVFEEIGKPQFEAPQKVQHKRLNRGKKNGTKPKPNQGTTPGW